MKQLISIILVFIVVSGCGQGFQVKDYAPTEIDKLIEEFNALKSSSLVKEMNFSTNDGLQNGASAAQNIASLTNPNDENQYVDTSTSLKDIYQSTISIWFKTENVNKIQHIIWQGVNDQNGWGGGVSSNTKSELNISLNHWNDTTGTVISSFLGYNESSGPPDLLPVMYPVTRDHTSGVFSTTGQRVTLDTNWHHLVISIDQKSAEIEMKTYLDGRLLESGVGSQIDTSIWNSNLFLGKPGINGQRNFWGQLKKFMLFNKILSPEEINMLYNIQIRE